MEQTSMSLLCKSKNLCEQQGYEYKYYMLDEDFTREEFLKYFNCKNFPSNKN